MTDDLVTNFALGSDGETVAVPTSQQGAPATSPARAGTRARLAPRTSQETPPATVRGYAAGAQAYLDAGWEGVLPILPGEKKPKVVGFHGRKNRGQYPSPAKVRGWCRATGNRDANLVLRPPEDVIGLDIDAYDAKQGEAALAEAVRLWGPLPATWRSTSRPDDVVSGIRWFRVPAGVDWHEVTTALNRQAGLKNNDPDAWRDIDTISWSTRYGVVWPSVHPEGRPYLWFRPAGDIADRVPSPNELADLPEPWVAGLAKQPEVATPEAKRSTASHSASAAGSDRVVAARNQTQWAEVAIAGRLDDIARTVGHRNVALNEHALRIWRIWLTGFSSLTEAEVEQALLDAVAATGYLDSDGDRAAVNTIRSAKDGAVRLGPAEDAPEPGPEFDRSSVDAEALTGRIEFAAVPKGVNWIWDTRPSLRHVKHAATARGVAPLPLLGVMVAHALTSVPPHVVLPPIIGGQASLNSFFALVGPSGMGKGATEAVAEDLLQLEAVDFDVTSPGSGEGLTRSFARYSKDAPDGMEWISDRVLMTLPEVDALTALTKRMGATLVGTLRMAWSGETLGFGYADREKAVKLPKHSYRLTFVLGVQPERAGELLADGGGGTPQRFIWLPTIDPDYDAGVQLATADPRPWQVQDRWDTLSGSVRPRQEIEVPREAQEVVLTNHEQRMRTGKSDLDGHALLARLKFAFGLAVLDSRTSITVEDWDIAGAVMEVSNLTRAWVQQVLEDEQHQQAAKVGRLRATTADAEEAGRGEAAAGRVLRKLQNDLAKAGGDWVSESELKRKQRSPDRQAAAALMDTLAATPGVETRPAKQGGRQFRVVTA